MAPMRLNTARWRPVLTVEAARVVNSGVLQRDLIGIELVKIALVQASPSSQNVGAAFDGFTDLPATAHRSATTAATDRKSATVSCCAARLIRSHERPRHFMQLLNSTLCRAFVRQRNSDTQALTAADAESAGFFMPCLVD